MSAIPQPNFEAQEQPQPIFRTEVVACPYCGSYIGATSQMCLTCGMPVSQADAKEPLRIATACPKLTPVPKPYNPYAMFYVDKPDEPRPTYPEPTIDAPGFGIKPASNGDLKEMSAAEYFRTSVVVLATVAVVLAAIFGLMTTWRSRSEIAANLEGVRARFLSMSAPRPNTRLQYTATPVKARRAKRGVDAPQSETATDTAPVAVGNGPGTVRVQISPAPPTPNVIPVTIQNVSAAAPLTEPVH